MIERCRCFFCYHLHRCSNFASLELVYEHTCTHPYYMYVTPGPLTSSSTFHSRIVGATISLFKTAHLPRRKRRGWLKKYTILHLELGSGFNNTLHICMLALFPITGSRVMMRKGTAVQIIIWRSYAISNKACPMDVRFSSCVTEWGF